MIEVVIAERLLATPAVTAIATGGVHQLIVPQHESRPAVRVQLIDQPQRAHLRGYVKVFLSRVQIDAFAQITDDVLDAYQSVADLSEAIAEALGPEGFPVGSPETEVLLALRDDRRPFEPDAQGNYRMLNDFRIWHRDP